MADSAERTDKRSQGERCEPRRKFRLRPAISVMAYLAIALGASGCFGSDDDNPAEKAASTVHQDVTQRNTQTIGGLTLPTSTGSPTPEEAEQIAQAAYVYGFPLVTMDGTLAQLTNVPSAQTFSAPVNQFNKPSKPVTPSFIAVPAAPVDVLFSNAWLDLSKEPLVFTMPNTNGVYNQMTILSGWTNVLEAPGKRTTGTGGGNFLLAGPGWNGNVPAGMKLIKSPTDLVWIEGSTQYDGPKSLKAVNDIQAGYKLTPLSDWGTAYKPPTNVPTDKNVDTSSTPQSQVQKMSPQAFFSELAKLMKENPPSAADAPVVKQLARIGIVPGKPFDWNKLSSDTQRKISRGVKKGEHEVTKLGLKVPGSTKENGWLVNLEKGWGNYGTDYSLRSAAAFSALGAVLPQDDTYFVAGGDAKRNSYTIKFPKGQTPPANAAWGIDMYDSKLHLVKNPIDRYALAPHLAPVSKNPDGSFTVYVQNKKPSSPKQQQNWLPAPDGAFLLVMHVYWPKESVLNAKWSPPTIKKGS